MRATSSQFQAAVRGSHVVAVEATLHVPGSAPAEVPVQGGAVADDGSAPIRRSGSLLIPWTLELDRLGLELDVRLLPFGSYVELRRGVRFADASRELVHVGYLRCESVAWDTSEDTARLELADRMAQVRDEKLLAPYSASGKTPSAAAVELVQAVFGASIAYHVSTSGEPTLVDVTYAGERVEAIADLARAVGARAYFDDVGDFVFEPIPDPSTLAPVATIDAGDEGVLVGASESLDRTQTLNGVLAAGQASATAPPVEALVVDDDPSSPTRWGGPFGKVAGVVTSSAIQSVAQAQAAARAELNRRLGLDRSLTLVAVPNPALVAGDVVEMRFPDGRVESHVLVAVRLPLEAAGAMELVTHSLYRPGVVGLELERPLRRRTRYGAQAWLELHDAKVLA